MGRYNLCTLLWISGPLPASIVATAIVVEDTLLESLNAIHRDFLRFAFLAVTQLTLSFSLPFVGKEKTMEIFELHLSLVILFLLLLFFFNFREKDYYLKFVKIIYERISTFSGIC